MEISKAISDLGFSIGTETGHTDNTGVASLKRNLSTTSSIGDLGNVPDSATSSQPVTLMNVQTGGDPHHASSLLTNLVLDALRQHRLREAGYILNYAEQHGIQMDLSQTNKKKQTLLHQLVMHMPSHDADLTRHLARQLNRPD